jgi:hypothetical protein
MKQQNEQEMKELQRVEQERKKKLDNMSEREKRAMAAETRLQQMQGNLKLCDNCSTPLTAIPFVRFEFKYCTTKCVQEHKKKIGS